MKPCASAGAQCPREAVLTARIYSIGDRALCQECHDEYVALGMGMRVLEANAFQPEWTQRNLARDFTGQRGIVL
jgi:hypothetical protein